MITLLPSHGGWILPVRALPGARQNQVRGEQDGALKVSVTQVAEKGKANAALRDVLAKALGLRKSQVELVAGETQAQKRFLIRGVSQSDLQARLAQLLSLDP